MKGHRLEYQEHPNEPFLILKDKTGSVLLFENADMRWAALQTLLAVAEVFDSRFVEVR